MNRFILFLLIYGIFNVQSQVAIQWQRTFGGSSYDFGFSAKPTGDGGFILAGGAYSNDGDVITTHDSLNVWIVKTDSTGNITWQKSIGGSLNEDIRSISLTSDGGYISAGYTESDDGDIPINKGSLDFLVIKSDSLGNTQWLKTFGGTFMEVANSVQQTNDGGYIVAGYTSSNDFDVSGNNGNSDMWIIKLDSTGNLQWQKCIGGAISETAYSIIELSTGGYMVAGYTNSNNSGMITGFIGWSDMLVGKLDNSGNLIWLKCYGGTQSEIAYSIKEINNNKFIIAGNSFSNNVNVTNNYGGSDYWIIVIDSTGSLIWEKNYGGTLNDVAKSIFVKSDGGFIIGGNATSDDGDVTPNGIVSQHYWVVNTDSMGNIIWNKKLGGSWNEYLGEVAQMTDSSIMVFGYSNSPDGDVIATNGNDDFWLVKLTDKFNTITGKCFLDLNNNNQHDVTEPIIPNVIITENFTNKVVLSNYSGIYEMNVSGQGNFMVTPQSIIHYTAVPSSHTSNFTGWLQTDSLKNFAFQPNGLINDLQVIVTNFSEIKPGFYSGYSLHVINKGTTSLGGTLTLYVDPILQYSSSPNNQPVLVTTDSLQWIIPTLNPMEFSQVYVLFQVNANAVLGTPVLISAKSEPIIGDATPGDNFDTLNQVVVSSFDPNDIQVNLATIPVNHITIPPYLEYIIRFQNTGTDTAFTVNIVNHISDKLDIASFELMSTSHLSQLKYDNYTRIMEFKFDNILLPDSNINEPLSHGFIRYKIKPRSNLTIGEFIFNSAAIYFDFNAPVITNIATTEIVLPDNINELNKNNSDILIYPNPALENISILFFMQNNSLANIELVNLTGQIIHSSEKKRFEPGLCEIKLSVQNLTKGVYFIKLSTEGTSKVKKFIKF